MTIYIWAEQLYNFFTFTVVIPVALGLNNWRMLTRSEQWVVVFLGAILLHELLMTLPVYINRRNHFLYYIQTILVLFTVAGVYSTTIGHKRFVWQLAATISLFMITEVIFRVGFNYINSVTLTASRLLPAIYACISLNRLFSVKNTHSLRANPMLYIHLGFFLFGFFTAINTCFKSYFIENSLNLYYLFDTLSAMISAVSFGLFSVGFIQVRSVHRQQSI